MSLPGVSPAAPSAAPRRPVAGNTATNLLKIIALAFMFIDHSGKVLCNNLQEMRILGRIAFPIYAWCMIVGFSRTRNVPRYLARLLACFVLSQPLYVLALDTEPHVRVLLQRILAPLSSGFSLAGLGTVLRTIWLVRPNVLLTLFLGVATLWGVREKKLFSQFWAPVLTVILATVLNTDYGWKAIVLFLLLYAVQDSRRGIAAVMISYFLFWGSFYSVTNSLFGLRFRITDLPAWLSSPLSAFLRLETYALLALPFILIRFPRDIRMPRWAGYLLYPAHLVLLIVLKTLIFG